MAKTLARSWKNCTQSRFVLFSHIRRIPRFEISTTVTTRALHRSTPPCLKKFETAEHAEYADDQRRWEILAAKTVGRAFSFISAYSAYSAVKSS